MRRKQQSLQRSGTSEPKVGGDGAGAGLTRLLSGAQRRASSDQPAGRGRIRPKWKEWLFGSGAGGRTLLKDEDIQAQLEEESGSIFPRRSLMAKAALDPRLRCTEVDGNGEVIMVDGELKKSELIARVGSDVSLVGCDQSADDGYSTAYCRAIYARSTRLTSHTLLFARRPFS